MNHTESELRQMQSMPLEYKILATQERIKAWYEGWTRFNIRNLATGEERFETIDTRDYYAEPKISDDETIESAYPGQVYVSFSGGKDSTVLLHIARQMYPDIEAVFVNTGLEYPEIQKFVKTFDNVTILRPKMRFDEVIKTYGYPLISKEVAGKIYFARKGRKEALMAFEGKTVDGTESKYRQRYKKWRPLCNSNVPISHKCCKAMKKEPAKAYEKETGRKPILATMAVESALRVRSWLQNGCNAFTAKRPSSQPMSFWTEQDVLRYAKENEIPIASVYGDIVYAENPEQMRFDDWEMDCGTEKLKTTGCNRTGCIFCGFGCHLEKEPSRFQRLKETHPRQYAYCMNGGEYDENGIWNPNKEGLGMRHAFEELNKIYGDDFIKYE